MNDHQAPTPERKGSRLPGDLLRWLILVPIILLILFCCGQVALLGLDSVGAGEIVSNLDVDYGPWGAGSYKPVSTQLIEEIRRDATVYPIGTPFSSQISNPGENWPTPSTPRPKPATSTVVAEIDTITPSPTVSPSSSATTTLTAPPTKTSTITPTPSPTLTPTRTYVPPPRPSNTPTRTQPPPTPSVTSTVTSTNTPSHTLTRTLTRTATHSPTVTLTRTPTTTPTTTNTSTITPTWTPTPTPTITQTPTQTGTSTATQTSTNTSTPTETGTPTATPTSTSTSTITNTPTATLPPTDVAPPGGIDVNCTTPLTIDLGADIYIRYLVYYESPVADVTIECFNVQPGDSGPGICMDWVYLNLTGSFGSAPGILFWGDGNSGNNGSLGDYLGLGTEVDNQSMPGIYSVTVNVYGTYRYIEIGTTDCVDPAQVRGLEVYP